MMRTVSLFVVMSIVTGCEASPPSYDQASTSVQRRSDFPAIKAWSTRTFGPFWDRHLKEVVVACSEAVNEGTSTTARFVVDARAAPKHVTIYESESTSFSYCVKQKMQALEWPQAPSEIRYLPIEINVDATTSEGQNADDVITSVTPSNKSLERTRER
jgi:hypothetical protein